jgi:hypothetical protein
MAGELSVLCFRAQVGPEGEHVHEGAFKAVDSLFRRADDVYIQLRFRFWLPLFKTASEAKKGFALMWQRTGLTEKLKPPSKILRRVGMES